MTAGAELARVEESAAPLARRDDIGISVEELIERVKKVKAVQAGVMQRDHHYGVIPGVNKPTLLKPGAEILCMTFRLEPDFTLDERHDGDHLEIVAKCILTHAPSGTRVGSGIGSCSTKESKYAYRKGERLCPECGKATLIKGKPEYEKEARFKGGWLCYEKKGGCGQKFVKGDAKIEGQVIDRVANPDLADSYNTVRKMACKRALVAAVLIVTCASELFTQDVEDGAAEDHEAPAPQQAQPPAAPKTPPVQAVPTDEDLDRAIVEIGEIQTIEGLGKHAAANRGKRWNKVQIEQLKAASEKRRAELTGPREGDADVGGEQEVPF